MVKQVAGLIRDRKTERLEIFWQITIHEVEVVFAFVNVDEIR